MFPLPRVERAGRVRPVALARLVGRLAADIVRSSVRVVALAFSRRVPRSAIIRVRLRPCSDLILTMTSELVSLVPGSLVLEVRRAGSTLYIHVLDTVEPAALERAGPGRPRRPGAGAAGLRHRRGHRGARRRARTTTQDGGERPVISR